MSRKASYWPLSTDYSSDERNGVEPRASTSGSKLRGIANEGWEADRPNPGPHIKQPGPDHNPIPLALDSRAPLDRLGLHSTVATQRDYNLPGLDKHLRFDEGIIDLYSTQNDEGDTYDWANPLPLDQSQPELATILENLKKRPNWLQMRMVFWSPDKYQATAHKWRNYISNLPLLREGATKYGLTVIGCHETGEMLLQIKQFPHELNPEKAKRTIIARRRNIKIYPATGILLVFIDRWYTPGQIFRKEFNLTKAVPIDLYQATEDCFRCYTHGREWMRKLYPYELGPIGFCLLDISDQLIALKHGDLQAFPQPGPWCPDLIWPVRGEKTRPTQEDDYKLCLQKMIDSLPPTAKDRNGAPPIDLESSSEDETRLLTRKSQLRQEYRVYRTPDQMFRMAAKAISPKKPGESELRWQMRIAQTSKTDKSSEGKGYIQTFCELDEGPTHHHRTTPRKTKIKAK